MRRRLVASLARYGSDEHGAGALEFALVSMPLLLFMFGITEYGRYLWIQDALQNTAASAARCAGLYLTTTSTCTTVGSCGCASAASTFSSSLTQTYVTNLALNSWGVKLTTGTGGNSTITAVSTGTTTCGSSTMTNFAQVTITYTFTPMVSLFPSLTNKTLTAQACFPRSS